MDEATKPDRPVRHLQRTIEELTARLAVAEARAVAAEEREAMLEERLAAAGLKHPLDTLALPPDAIFGACEQPSREVGVVSQAVLTVSGWVLSRTGIERVAAFVDGEARGHINYGELRPDVAALHPGFPDAENAGFAGVVPVDDLADGEHALLIRVLAKNGRRAELRARFETRAGGRAANPVTASLERPSPDDRAVVFDRLAITGWAIAPNGIERVDALLDGEPAGDLTYGVLRPDVALTHPTYVASDYSGFAGALSIAGLADGPHELTIRATALGGQWADLVAGFDVDSRGAIVGEVPLLNAQYPAWLERHTPSEEELTRAKAEAAAFTAGPVFTLIVPLDPTLESRLDDLVRDLRTQVYPRWQVCFLADAVTRRAQHARLRHLAEVESRVKLVEIPGRADLSTAATAALNAADGDFATLFDPHDALSPLALLEAARAVAAEPETDLLYVDEDKLDPESGLRWDPFFKPDWSPELLLAAPYLGRFALVRRSLAQEVGGFRPGFEGEETYDLTLRVAERARRVTHVPRLLHSRRGDPTASARQVAGAGAEARRRAVLDALARRGLAASVEPGLTPGTARVRYALPSPLPGVTVVMPTGGKLQFLRPCLEDLLRRTSYPNLHVVVIDNSDGDGVEAICREYAAAGLNLRREALALKPFNFSALINRGVELVATPYLILLNDDVTVLTPDWIEALLEHAQWPGAGAVGPKLLYPDGSIQHAGVIFGPYGGVGHAFRRYPGDHQGYFGLPNATREYSAVTFACAMLRRDLMAEIGPLDEERFSIAFNDTDYCLRLGAAGYRNLYTPHAALTHHESVTKKLIARPEEIEGLLGAWAGVIARDPGYNPNLTRTAEDCSLNLA